MSLFRDLTNVEVVGAELERRRVEGEGEQPGGHLSDIRYSIGKQTDRMMWSTPVSSGRTTQLGGCGPFQTNTLTPSRTTVPLAPSADLTTFPVHEVLTDVAHLSTTILVDMVLNCANGEPRWSRDSSLSRATPSTCG